MKKVVLFGAAIVLLMVVATCGCTSNNNGSSNGGSALTMTAKVVGTTYAADGTPIVEVNATLTNNNAGTIKTSSDNFIMQDSSGVVVRSLGTEFGHTSVDVLDNGHTEWTDMHFYLTPGSSAQHLTYYDGTNKVECDIS